jgi:hypothetical protein
VIIRASVPAAPTKTQRFLVILEWPMAVLALAVLPALVLEDAGATPRIRAIAHGVNWFVWLAFVADYVIRLAVAPRQHEYVRRGQFIVVVRDVATRSCGNDLNSNVNEPPDTCGQHSTVRVRRHDAPQVAAHQLLPVVGITQVIRENTCRR